MQPRPLHALSARLVRWSLPPPHPGALTGLWCLGLTSLIGSAVLAFATLDWDGVWVIGSWVPRRIDAVGALSGAGLLLLLLAVHCKRVMARRGPLPRKRHRAQVIGARLMTVAVLLVALPLTAFVAFLDGWDAFHVLQPAALAGAASWSKRATPSTAPISTHRLPGPSR